MKGTALAFFALVIVFAAAYFLFDYVGVELPAPSPTSGPESESASPVSEEVSEAEVVATGLDTPWAIAFLPDGTMLATERPGRLRVFGANPQAIEVTGVQERGEGGLLGLAVHPDFSSNRSLYLYYTTVRSGETINRVVRYVFDGVTLTENRVIADNLPASANHNGGRAHRVRSG